MKMFLQSKDVQVDIYSEVKYTASEEVFENVKTVRYSFCVGFDVVNGKEAEIEKTDGSCVDDYDEYLVLYFEDGDTATFRNSYVDLFMLGTSKIA